MCTRNRGGGGKRELRGDYEVLTAESQLLFFRGEGPLPPLTIAPSLPFPLASSSPLFRNIQFLEEVYGVVSVGKLPVIY